MSLSSLCLFWLLLLFSKVHFFEFVDNSPCVDANDESPRFTTSDKEASTSTVKKHENCDLCINFLLLTFCFLELSCSPILLPDDAIAVVDSTVVVIVATAILHFFTLTISGYFNRCIFLSVLFLRILKWTRVNTLPFLILSLIYQ